VLGFTPTLGQSRGATTSIAIGVAIVENTNFENMESHGESIKLVLRQLITWTPPKEGITLLEFFGVICIGFKALLQSRMVIWRYFYIDIDPIARQMATLKMMEFTSRFPQQFATTPWFQFLAFGHTTNSEKTYRITWPCGPHHFKFKV
jgi:hypothetical protein